MPRRSILSAAERESLLALPEAKDDLIRQYTFSETDLSLIRQGRGPANRLGFAVSDYRPRVQSLVDLAWRTDKGIVLAAALIDGLRLQGVLLPSLNVIERISAEAITRANRRIYAALTDSLSAVHRQRVDDLLRGREGSKITRLAWLRQSPAKPNSRHMLEHIERLKAFQALELPAGIERQVHQNRLLKIAREGG